MVFPLTLPFVGLGWAKRAQLVKENKLLQQRLAEAGQNLQASHTNLQQLSNPFSNLLPKVGAGAAGLAGAKVASDTISPTQKVGRKQVAQLGELGEDAMQAMSRYSYAGHRSATFGEARYTRSMDNDTHVANFIDPISIGLGVENAAASMVWNMKNSKLRNLQKMYDNHLTGLQTQLKAKQGQLPKTLAKIGLGTAAVATPALAYMNGQRKPNPGMGMGM